MGSLAISLVVTGVVIGGAMLGMVIQSVWSVHCQDADAKDIVKPAMGLIATLSALVLGLVIATAKSSYDEKSNQVRQMTARIIALDNILVQYGPETTVMRTQLRHGIGQLAERIWQEGAGSEKRPFQPSAEVLTFLGEIEGLSPRNDSQRLLQVRAVQTLDEIAKARLLLFAQAGTSIPTPFLIILVFWFASLFVSFTLFSKANPIAFAALAVSALSIGGAIFLLLELDNPFSGLMQIPSTLLTNALSPLGP
jgi:hypothetical protein